MTELSGGDDLERMVQQYLGELGQALARLPAVPRERLVGEIRDHIVELRAERPPRDASDMEALLNRVGLPEDIAAVALEDIEDSDEVDGLPQVAALGDEGLLSRRSRQLMGVVGAAIVLVLVAVVSVAATHHSEPHGSGRAPASIAPTTRPDGSPPRSSVSRLTVPNVIGANAAQAEVELQSAGFAVNLVSDPSGDVPGGEVYAQGPAAGAYMADGSMVTVYVSTGPAS